jgi:hypothetical protein
MRTKEIIVSMVAVSIFLLISIAFAQEWEGWRGTEGWGLGHPYQLMLDPKAPVETLSGEVIHVQKITPKKGMAPGVHVILHTDKETVPVHLGPAWFIEHLDVKILKGDKIEVKGSRVSMTIEEKPELKAQHVLIASEVKKGDKVLILRDATGEPVWAGWRKIEEKK